MGQLNCINGHGVNQYYWSLLARNVITSSSRTPHISTLDLDIAVRWPKAQRLPWLCAVLSCDALDYTTMWAGDIRRHTTMNKLQSRR